ncbi:RNA polymerase sigma factor region1.1 domain-containing protein [Bradyrhizobium sp. STM 3809]|uniref:RNA polymerase sigma factor region1.1 domain-containing protein n=1 Tax=Bradyrhizobium sp. STM 3809 TaxID=551936 RepID=UPI0002407634|nr:RNA polymerase sigma factor region1.1 domain-containing protein [Bradyrhizobium sp. STM 3809]CCD98321.1 conserved hypothetical protein [Bradyrhizobium sp. STM 3809]
MTKLAETIAIQRLVAFGRNRGVVTADDLKAMLPVQDMTAEELAGVMSTLEDAGVPVEIDTRELSASGPHGQPIRASFSATSASGPAAPSLGADPVRSTSRDRALPVVVADEQPRGRTGLIVLLAGATGCGLLLVAGWLFHW